MSSSPTILHLKCIMSSMMKDSIVFVNGSVLRGSWDDDFKENM